MTTPTPFSGLKQQIIKLRNQTKKLAAHNSATRCEDCQKPIEDNDDANVCIQCGGYSVRLTR